MHVKLTIITITAGTTLTSGRPSQPVTRRWTLLWLNCPGWVGLTPEKYRVQTQRFISDLSALLLLLFQNYSGELNYLVALHELYKYINKYYDQVCTSLRVTQQYIVPASLFVLGHWVASKWLLKDNFGFFFNLDLISPCFCVMTNANNTFWNWNFMQKIIILILICCLVLL